MKFQVMTPYNEASEISQSHNYYSYYACYIKCELIYGGI